MDLALGLGDPIATGDANVEEAIGHVHGDLLGAQDAHLGDAGIIDGGPVLHRRVARDLEISGFEEFECGLLERTLGEDELQHGRQPTASPLPTPNGFGHPTP